MSNADLFLVILLMVGAMGLVLQNMADERRVQYRPGCAECANHKRLAEEAEKRRQAQLLREYEERTRRLPPGAGEGVECQADKGEIVKQQPPKRPGGGWMA